MSQPKKVEVEWIDSTSRGAWLHLKERATHPLRCSSVGYVIHEDSESLTIAQNYCAENETHADTTTIPKGCIKKRRRL